MGSRRLSTLQTMSFSLLIRSYLHCETARRNPIPTKTSTQSLLVYSMASSDVTWNLTMCIKLSWCLYTGVKVSKYYGAIPFAVHQKKSTSRWSTTVKFPLVWFKLAVINSPISETGGLLRIGIKLMMACSTSNTDMCVHAAFRKLYPYQPSTVTTCRW